MARTSVGAPQIAGVERASSTLTVPVWRSSFTYGGHSYPFAIVGTNPITSPIVTPINVTIVPLRLTFANGTILDATSTAAVLPKSPLFVAATYAAGKTQYGDALMRSEFWSYIHKGAANYHVLLASPKLEPTLRLTVPSSDGYAIGSGSTVEGRMNFAWFVQSEEKQIIDTLHIPPSSLTIFATVNARVLEPFKVNGAYYCCYNGYHYDFPVTTTSGQEIWTTAWASTTSTNLDHLSHEIAEWFNDPFYTNFVPRWVAPQTNACGGDQLEVGDPVTLHYFQVNGFTLQDEAFYSWFSRQNPSVGINGLYDLQGVLKQPAANC
jgi:hypothetical protein